MKADQRVRYERLKQKQKGYTIAHDRANGTELLRAASCYLDYAASLVEGVEVDVPHPFWPWDDANWNPGQTLEEIVTKATAMASAYYDANLDLLSDEE